MDKVDEIGLEVRDLLGGAHVVPVLRAALVGVEHLVEQDGRLARSTLVLAHDGARLLLHAMAVLRLVEEARDLCRQLRAVLHRQAGVAVLKSAYVSLKLNMCEPTMMALPCAAGSRMLWPPCGTRLPPTKTTSPML
mgnify:CR=1 FL=1